MNTLEDWEDIKFFIALAKEKRLQRAAKLIQSNHTTVYRRILNFEEKFGVKLFESTPYGYNLTPAGEELYEKIDNLEDRMDEIFNSLQGLETKLKGNIQITTTSSVATTFLPFILKKLQKSWPDLFIDLKVSNNFYNLSKREADIAIRPSSDVPEHLIGRNLGKINFSVFASMSYLKENEKLGKLNLQNLKNHTHIILDESLEHLKSKKWIDSRISEETRVYRVNGLSVMAQMCSNGIGLALLPDYYGKVYKNLVVAYRPKDFIGSDFWILSHKNMSKIPRVKTCTDFLYKEILTYLF